MKQGKIALYVALVFASGIVLGTFGHRFYAATTVNAKEVAATKANHSATPSPETLVMPAGTSFLAVLDSKLSTDSNKDGDPFVAVTGHHDVILHRPFSHPFPNTGSRSRSIARKVPGRTSPACWATVVRAVTSVPSARVARASYWRWEPRWRSRTPPLRSMSLMTSLAVISIV